MNKRLHRNNEKKQLDVIENGLLEVTTGKVSEALSSVELTNCGKPYFTQHQPNEKSDFEREMLITLKSKKHNAGNSKLIADQYKTKLQQVIIQTSKTESSAIFTSDNELLSTYEHTGKAINSKEFTQFSFSVQKNLRKKYGGKQGNYNARVVEDILCNDNTHAVCVFKDYLIYDDVNEFMQRVYSLWEAKNRLIKAFDFYFMHSKSFPNYAILKARKYMLENVMKKLWLLNKDEVKKTNTLTKHEHVFTTKFIKEMNADISRTNRFSIDSSTQLKSYIKSQMKDMSFKELLDKFIQKDSRSLIDANAASKEFEISNASELNFAIEKKQPKERGVYKAASSDRRKSCTNSQSTKKKLIASSKAIPKENHLQAKELSGSRNTSKGKQTPTQNAKKFTSTVKKKCPTKAPLKAIKSETSIKNQARSSGATTNKFSVEMKKGCFNASKRLTLSKVQSKTILDTYATVFRATRQGNSNAVQLIEKCPFTSKLLANKFRTSTQTRTLDKRKEEVKKVNEKSKKFRSEYLNALSSRTKLRTNTQDKKKSRISKPESIIRLQQPFIIETTNPATTKQRPNERQTKPETISRNTRKDNMEKYARTYR
jgi:hypothetical protein